MIRRPPRSTLFPYTSSSDLPAAERGYAYSARCVWDHRRGVRRLHAGRSEEHTSELSHLGSSYAVFCLKKKIGRQCSQELVATKPRSRCPFRQIDGRCPGADP